MPAGKDEFVALLELHLRTIEELLADRSLARLRASAPSHPAVIRYDAVRDFISGPGHIVPGKTLAEITSFMLDLSTWASLKAGGLASIPADKLLRVRGTASEPEQFDDAMAELFYLGFLSSDLGFSTELVERDGFPDLLSQTLDRGDIWTEVKRIRDGTGPDRVQQVLKKASKQLKSATGGGSGVVFISFAPTVVRMLPGDGPPTDLDEKFRRASKVLAGGTCRGVAVAVLCWDELLEFPEPDGRSLVALQRRSQVLQHAQPNQPVPFPAAEFAVARTVEFRIRWRRASPSSGAM